MLTPDLGNGCWKASIAYVTGTHAMKLGYQHALMTDDRTWMTNNQSLTYRVNNGVPNQLTQSISPWVNNARAGWNAVFVQEQWTRGAADAARRAAFSIALAASAVSHPTRRPLPISADANRRSGNARHRQLYGHHTTIRDCLRSDRQRRDSHQDERRQITWKASAHRESTPTPIPRRECLKQRRRLGQRA